MKALSHSDAYQVLLLQIADELLDAVAGGVLDDSHKRYMAVCLTTATRGILRL